MNENRISLLIIALILFNRLSHSFSERICSFVIRGSSTGTFLDFCFSHWAKVTILIKKEFLSSDTISLIDSNPKVITFVSYILK